MKIELKCSTAGFKYGDIVEVGGGKGQIAPDVAKGLISEKLAVEVNPKLLANQKELEEIMTALKAENKMLKAHLAELESRLQAPNLPDGDDGTPVDEMEWGAMKSLAAKVYGADTAGMKKDAVKTVIEEGRAKALSDEG